MIKIVFSLLLLPILSFKGFSQVEIPQTESKCKLMNTKNFWYCINALTYQTQWTAIKIEKAHIENHQYFPPDKDFFPSLSKIKNNDWGKLENQVKYWALEFDSVFVVTGDFTVFDSIQNQPKLLFYKVILKGCKGDAIGFLIGNNTFSESLISYAVPVDSIEKITGHDFFPSLSPDLQSIIESEFNADFWPISIP